MNHSVTTSPETREDLARQLCKALRLTARPRWMALWISGHVHDRVAALREMPAKALRHAVLKQMVSADASVKVLVAFLEQIESRALKTMLPQARPLADHGDGRVRRAALAAVMACDPAEAEKAGLEALCSPSADQRAEALDFLIRHHLLGGCDAPEPLMLALSDENAAVARHAYLWLKKIAHADMLGWLELQMQNAAEQVTWRIAVVAADLGSNEALHCLLGPAGDLTHPGSEDCALALARRRDSLAAQFVMSHWLEIHAAWHPHLCRVMGAQKDDPQALAFLLSLIEKNASDADWPLLPEIHPCEVYFGRPDDLECEAGIYSEGNLGRLLRHPLRGFVFENRPIYDSWWWYWSRWGLGDTRERASFYSALDDMMSSVFLTGLTAARVFAGWSGEDAMQALLALRLRGSGNVERIAGYALAAGGPWDGPYSESILDHLALRGFRGLQAWWEACRHESAEMVLELINLRRASLPSLEFHEQLETGLNVALQAVNMPVVEELISLKPSLADDLPVQLLGIAEGGGWQDLERLTQSPVLKEAFIRCRRRAALAAIRQCLLHEFMWCEDMDAGSPLSGVGDALNEVLQHGGYASGHRVGLPWMAFMGFLSRPSVRAQASSFKDTIIRRFILEGEAELLMTVQEMTPDIVTAIRPSEFCRLFCERSGYSNSMQDAWDSLEAFSRIPYLRPYFLDSCEPLKHLALCQGRPDRFEWLESLLPDEKDFWLGQVFTSLDSLLNLRDAATLRYLLRRLEAIGLQRDACHVWLALTLDRLLRHEDDHLLTELFPLFLLYRWRTFRAVPKLFTPARVTSALFYGRLLEVRWLLFMMEGMMIWSIADRRAFAQNAARCFFNNERQRFLHCGGSRLHVIEEALYG